MAWVETVACGGIMVVGDRGRVGTVAGWGPWLGEDRGRVGSRGRGTHKALSGDGSPCPPGRGRRGAVALPVSLRAQPWFTGPWGAVLHLEVGCSDPLVLAPLCSVGRPGAGFAEGGGFWHRQGSGPQRDRSLTVRHQPAGVRAGPATPPWSLLGRVQGEPGLACLWLCQAVQRHPVPGSGSASAVSRGSRAPRLPSGRAHANIARPAVGQRMRAVPATIPPPGGGLGPRTGSQASRPPHTAGPPLRRPMGPLS